MLKHGWQQNMISVLAPVSFNLLYMCINYLLYLGYCASGSSDEEPQIKGIINEEINIPNVTRKVWVKNKRTLLPPKLNTCFFFPSKWNIDIDEETTNKIKKFSHSLEIKNFQDRHFRNLIEVREVKRRQTNLIKLCWLWC